MKVYNGNQIQRGVWAEYVDQNENGTVFHTPYMYDVFLATNGFDPFAFFVVDDSGKVQAMLTGYLQTVKRGMLAKISTRSVMLQGPLFDTETTLALLVKHYLSWTQGKALYSEIRNHFLDDKYSRVMLLNGFSWEGHYNIVKEIPSDSGDLWKQIGRKRKDGINKAKKFGFEICQDNSSQAIQSLYRLVKNSYSKLRLPIPSQVFFENCKSLDLQDNCKLFMLIDNGDIRIVLLSFLYKCTLHALYIGTDQDPDFTVKRPVDYFYYKIMEWCCDHGVKYFDWMGAGKPNVSYGVRDFKLQYGGELVDYGRFIAIHSALKYKIAQTGFKLLQKMKGNI